MTGPSADVDVVDRRRTVVTALPLKRRARQRLAEQLGDVRVVDIRDPVDTADLVLAPSCSPQTIAALADAYPDARVIVVEIEDWDLHVDLPGPVMRLLKAGADGYLTAESIDDLAAQLGAAPAPETEQRATQHALEAASTDQTILAALHDRLIAKRHSSVDRRDHGT